MSPDLVGITANVAKALELGQMHGYDFCWYTAGNRLERNGSNIFDPYWQVRCRDWLLRKGYALVFDSTAVRTHDFWKANDPESKMHTIACSANEFCARAIHMLMLLRMIDHERS